MKHIIVTILLLMPAAAFAQSGRINIDLPPSLAAKAAESTDVALDGALLRLASKFLSEDDAEIRDVVRKLEGIYVHSYEFDADGQYDRSIVDSIRRQIGPEWKRIVTVKSKFRENSDVYALQRGDALSAIVVISAEPRQLTIVNIVGSIDLDKLASLEGNFGIPRTGKHE